MYGDTRRIVTALYHHIASSSMMSLRRQCVPSWCLRVTFIDDVLCRVRHLIQCIVHLRLILENERSDELMVDEDGTVPRCRHHAVDEEHALQHEHWSKHFGLDLLCAELVTFQNAVRTLH